MRRDLFTFFAAITAVVVMAVAIQNIPQAFADTQKTNTVESTRFSRACIFPSGGWVEVDCSAAAASSAALTKNTRYIVQCSQDSYFAPGTAASGQDADSSDGYLPAGEWLEMLTTDTVIYYSCESSTSAGTCKHIECQ